MSVLFVAELGSMHKGNPALAREMIRQAARSGASIAKFQFGWPEDDKVRCVDHMASELSDACAYYGIELMASIWSQAGLDTARRVGMKRYKIAHQKADDEELVAAILADGNETFVSGTLRWPHLNARPVYTTSDYPTRPQELGLKSTVFGVHAWYGYSDHTHGIEACLLSVARGALYVEKHFCLDKTDLTVRDTPFSATPDEFAALVENGRGIRRLLDAAL